MTRVCFVCLGNICRSPTAEGVMRHLVRQSPLASDLTIDSAGTDAYHVGEPPDERATIAARRRGIELGGKARRFSKGDFAKFDLVVAMDDSNRRDLLSLAPDEFARAKVCLLRSFDDASEPGASVPDPYYGGDSGFEDVLDICTAGCQGLLRKLERDSSPR